MQQIGRAGRNGDKPAQCYCMYSIKDNCHNIYLISQVKDYNYKNTKLDSQIEVNKLVYTLRCRRQLISSYFLQLRSRDEKISSIQCGNCDNCFAKKANLLPETRDFSEEILLLLRVINCFDPSISSSKFIALLRGSKNKELCKTVPELQKHEFFGAGANYSTSAWQTLLQYACNVGYVRQFFRAHDSIGVTYSVSSGGNRWLLD